MRPGHDRAILSVIHSTRCAGAPEAQSRTDARKGQDLARRGPLPYARVMDCQGHRHPAVRRYAGCGWVAFASGGLQPSALAEVAVDAVDLDQLTDPSTTLMSRPRRRRLPRLSCCCTSCCCSAPLCTFVHLLSSYKRRATDLRQLKCDTYQGTRAAGRWSLDARIWPMSGRVISLPVLASQAALTMLIVASG